MKIRGRNAAYQKSRVICAMSGGVDSSVSAAILKRNGYDVVGVFIIMNENSNPADAKEVAKKLNIPFEVLDEKREFRKRVVDYFINEYKKGRTPNPCVECNKWIKFRFPNMATGHYARVKNGRLFVAKDKQKDQSYFLWTLKQNQLKRILFPIGDYTKKEVREMAKKWDLPVFNKKDSQNICFTVPRQSFQAKAGLIITVDGKKVGEHKGLVFYTIGQRKGIKIGGTGPYYVIRKDFKDNILIVSKSEKDLLSKEMTVKNINWISGKAYAGKCKVKIRSTAPMVWAIVKKNKVVFDKLQRAITSGQSAVFYQQNRVLGGGIIC
jgi:tRNA-specific 2-thiouridylase